MDKDPSYTGYIRTMADRGKNMNLGWVDTTNNKAPGFIRYNNTTEDETTGGRGRSLRYDYGGHHVLMASANGTKYWVLVVKTEKPYTRKNGQSFFPAYMETTFAFSFWHQKETYNPTDRVK